MIRKKVLSIGNNSATLLVQDTEAGGALRVLRRMNVAGWAAEEVSAAVRMYEELQKRRLRGFVPIHTVLIQSSFLSVVASYASEGDVTTLIEEEEHNSLEEASVLRWLCACALAIRQLHLHNLFFPGLTGDRLFLDHHTGGTANLLLGVPLPLPVYYSQLQERKKSGLRVELDYPPEVLAAAAAHPNGSGEAANHSARSGSGYHPTLSDVWCLGRLGVVLLTAKGTNMARRSGTARQLLSRMMADEPATRPSMESVVQSLVALAGAVSLGQPPWPSHPATAPSTISAHVASASSAPAMSSRQPHIAASGSAGGSAAIVVQSAAAENRSAGGGAPKAQCTTKGASHGCASSPPPSSTTSSTPPDVPSTRVHNSQRHSAGTPVTVEHSSPPPPMSAPTPHLDHPGRLTHAPDDSWHRRAGEKFELLQRMNASPPKQHAFIGGGETPQGTSRGEHGHHRLRRSTSNLLNTKSPSPRRNSRGGLIDHNTRVLDEIFAEQGELLRKAGIWHLSPRRRMDDAKQFQRETLRQLRLETAARQQEMRKHFTEWQRQNNQRLTDANNVDVIDQDGIVIVAPRPAPPHEFLPVATAAPAAEEEEMDTSVEPPKSRTQFTEDAQSDASACQTPLPASPPPPNSASRPATPRTKTPAGGSTPAAAVNAYSTRYSGNMPRPSHTSLSTQEAYGARGAGFSALPLRGATSPRLPPPPPDPVQPYPLRSSDSSGQVTSPSNDSDERPMHSADGGGRSALKSSTDVGTLSAVEWTIDGIRSTLRMLLRNRNLYGETMQEVALFISQPEEARLAARANEIFMKRLRKLLRDDALFFGAVPLCAQLAALEGLDHTLRDSSSSLPSRQRY
ncbi:conserved hypothetical protein [Leishmania infantum JPCM5]|uniref:Uncharacterized protein n=2 Tax=Leishmania infantum TaxID=5671 RepID=A4I3P4_LEIIN|nr:conserved hypothetical protein [Leishmania infantum JPCM5]CAC9503819.1 hypothetical_protein_-_conserved [Leishmania infantum]CAM69399.1 conserved hypothetical protein [Leishmania infantum JPCM5]SUZ43341.1 hypothetical_protein_-_conserved [Leishmania infantum]|eukprot:XP_001470206.1 conserved hypothetical protein [Leishmania infantum JPCM5]